MTNINELNTAQNSFNTDDTKLNDLGALDLVLQKQDVREAFLKQIDILVRTKRELLNKQEAYKDLLKSTKESFRFKTTGLISRAVDAAVKDILQDEIDLSNAESDLFEIILEHVEGNDE